MKKTMFILTAACFLTSSIILMSCKTAAQKSEAKRENVVEAKADLELAQKEVTIQTAVNAEEWKTFKEESKIRILDNNKRIAELRAKMDEPGSNHDENYAKRISSLEQKNKDLDISIKTFENSKSSDWQIFKRDFNQGMDEIGKALKGMVVSN